MATTPRCKCQRKITCAAVRSCASAISTIVGSFKISLVCPLAPNGYHACTTMPKLCIYGTTSPAVNPSRIKTGWIREQNMILLVYHVTPRQGFSPYLQNNPSYFCFFRLGYGSTVCAGRQRSGNRCIKLHTKKIESKSSIPVSALFCLKRNPPAMPVVAGAGKRL